MFKKDAEEYFNKTYNDIMIRNRNTVTKAFQDGAEFGYNKANEWHYVKDGDLPTRDCMVLLHWESAIGSNTVITYWKKGKFLHPYNRKDITVAWQEIIPPKGSK